MSSRDPSDDPAAAIGVLINWQQNGGDVVDQVLPNMEAANSDTDHAIIPAPVSPWTWSGIHNSATTPQSSRIHPFLTESEDLGEDSRSTQYLLAGAGGLLVLMVKSSVARITDSQHKMLTMQGTMPWRSPGNPEPGPSTSFALHGQNWHPLVVHNPLRSERRVLPAADCRDVDWSSWDYHGVVVHFVVDDQAQSFQLTLTFPTCVCVYRSIWNRWKCLRFPQPGPWGAVPQTLINTAEWDVPVCASASVGEHLFLADVEPEPGTSIRLFEIDPEAGEWKRLNWSYSLQSQYWDFLQTPVLRNRGLMDGNGDLRNHGLIAHHKRVLVYFDLVVCVGEMYAVVPARLEEYLPMSLRSLRTLVEVLHEYPNFGLEFLPLQFLIVQLRGDGFVHGVLRILVPDNLDRHCYGDGHDDVGNQQRKRSLFAKIGQEYEPFVEPEDWGFSCTAEGNVIWVAVEDYLLQYDVVTGLSKTEVIVAGVGGQSHAVVGVPYRPSNVRP